MGVPNDEGGCFIAVALLGVGVMAVVYGIGVLMETSRIILRNSLLLLRFRLVQFVYSCSIELLSRFSLNSSRFLTRVLGRLCLCFNSAVLTMKSDTYDFS